MSTVPHLKSAIGNMVQVQSLHEGAQLSERVGLDLVAVEPFHLAFRRMVRDLEFELSEMPIATLGQALSAGVPIVGLPIPASRRMHHTSILCRIDSDIGGPQDLIGRRVAARSWPQTSGIWIRGILQHEYGIDLRQVQWIIQEGPHVPQFADPDFVTLEESDESLLDLLRTGKVDAITGLHGIPEGTRPVIDNAREAAAAWYERTGIFPVNHVICLRRDVLAANQWLPEAITDVFTKAADIARRRGDLDSTRHGLPPGLDLYRIGLEANRSSMQMLVDYSIEQQILPASISLESLFV
ncbi:substrate-binding domain-containing protein [Devosia sp. A369]